ncbi:hypothetical protein [Merismopedia glauca]|uniref:hypothetical protein n=1 Tax=Merismopedia glauca TaxID=292586 RepID=UPI0011B29D80|nr:hypothetical protein [Merismopedia glauca]
MNIKQSFRIQVGSNTVISCHSQTVNLIADGEMLSLSFDHYCVNQLSEIIAHLQKIETEIISEQLARLQKHRHQVSLPEISSEYRNLEC